jgi:pentose-5-phosphate-3-epimerase
MKQEVIPAVMPENINDIASAAVSVRHAVETVQLDLMDGKYVPESTWPFTTHRRY